MKHRFAFALVGLVGLVAVGCAEEDAQEPQSPVDSAAQASEAGPEVDAEATKVEVAAAKDGMAVGGGEIDQAKPVPGEPTCFPMPWGGGEICCTPKSCVIF